MENKLFRQKSIDRISSPEELHDYMRVTSPRLWMILGAVAVLLIGFIVYAATTRMESTETIELRSENGYIAGLIPQSRKDLIAVDMPVRIDGRTGKINVKQDSLQYRINANPDSGEPLEPGYYYFTIGDSEDSKAVLAEYGINGFIISDMDPYALAYVLQKLDSGETRARIWEAYYSEEENDIMMKGGRPATVSGYETNVTTYTTVKLDDPEPPLQDGTYDVEVVTESTTPISFLWNK